MLILILFIISSILFGSYLIGPFSIRVYVAIALIIYLLYKRIVRKNHFNLPYSSIWIYLLFLFFTLIAKIFSGPFEIDGFFKDLFAMHLIAITSYIAIDLLVKHPKQIRAILILLIIIGLFNSIVSILQYNGNATGFIISQFFATSEIQYISDLETRFLTSSELQLGAFAVPGIFGHGASNGGMNATLSILSLYFIFGKDRRLWWIALIIFIIGAIGSFVIQERSPMGLLAIFALLIIWKYSPKRLLILLCAIGCFILFYFDLFSSLNPEKIGRFADITKFGSDRQQLAQNAIVFISDHWFLGGDYLYHQIYGLTPHNFILHAFIYSGLFGALTVFALFIKIIIDAGKIFIHDKIGFPAFFFGCALVIFLANGFTHSSSLITGDNIIWLLYALMLHDVQLERKQS